MSFTYAERLEALRAAKLAQTLEKQQIIGSMNHDDWALILPPPDRREVVQTISGSGMPITDVRLKGFEPKPNHPSGGFFGPRAVGENFRALLECHPTYVDPNSSLAGGYMANFMTFRKPHWNPDLVVPEPLREAQAKYQLLSGIGGVQHFCQDLAIGLDLGWGGLLDRIRHFRSANAPTGAEFYDGLEHVVLGMQNWLRRTAEAARAMAEAESEPAVRENLEAMADINQRLVTEPPRTFREACQWMLWYQIAARMFNGSGSLGRLDLLLLPFYEPVGSLALQGEVGPRPEAHSRLKAWTPNGASEAAAGTLDDEEAIFHVACLLLRDTAYIQLGGPDATGSDATNPVSFLVLEATHRLKIPANVGVCAGEGCDPRLLRRGVEVLLSDKAGIPKFLGVANTAKGFARNGFPMEVARTRAYSGCHWSAIPGREYTLNDCIKINFAQVFDVALREMMEGKTRPPVGSLALQGEADPQPEAHSRLKAWTPNEASVAELWDGFVRHLGIAVEAIIAGVAYHLEHMADVFPELVLDLLCHGTIEQGLDASAGGVEFRDICLDGAALATVADSFAALEQRVEQERRLTWAELMAHLDADWAGPDGEQARLMMRSVPRFGSGRSPADAYAVRIAQAFTRLVKETPTPGDFIMIPGLFSWANTIPMGKGLGATPNGRRAGEPISHGANPDPGFRKDGAPTAMATAIAAVQPGYGNTAPMQIEVDPMLPREEDAVEAVASLIQTHFALGGTQVNINVVDAEKLLAAHEDPSRYPDLVVRVTGFSAYFASLSPEFRQLVVDRVIAGN